MSIPCCTVSGSFSDHISPPRSLSTSVYSLRSSQTKASIAILPSELAPTAPPPRFLSSATPRPWPSNPGRAGESTDPPINAASTVAPAAPAPRTNRLHHRSMIGGRENSTDSNERKRLRSAPVMRPQSEADGSPRARNGSSSRSTHFRKRSAGSIGSVVPPLPRAATTAAQEQAAMATGMTPEHCIDSRNADAPCSPLYVESARRMPTA